MCSSDLALIVVRSKINLIQRLLRIQSDRDMLPVALVIQFHTAHRWCFVIGKEQPVLNGNITFIIAERMSVNLRPIAFGIAAVNLLPMFQIVRHFQKIAAVAEGIASAVRADALNLNVFVAL